MRLANDELQLVLLPENGAKIVGFRRKRGREWLYPQRDRVDPDCAAFDAAASFGWDELFPTVLSDESAGSPWDPPLRDHGELWGRPWQIEESSPGHARLSFDDPAGRFHFKRSATLVGKSLKLEYAIENRTLLELPFLWSMHPVLSVREGDEILLPGIVEVVPTYLRHPTLQHDGAPLSWPIVTVEGETTRVDRVPAWDGLTAAKLYAGPQHRALVAIHGDDGWLAIEADPHISFVGIYLNYGGWPDFGSPLYQVGLEPTTAPADDLTTAISNGHARAIPPSRSFRWEVWVHAGLAHEQLPALFRPSHGNARSG